MSGGSLPPTNSHPTMPRISSIPGKSTGGRPVTRSCCAVACCGAALLLLSNDVNGEERKDSGPRVKFEIRLAEKEPAEGLEEMVASKTEVKIYVHKPAVVSNADIAEARA